MGIQSRLKFGVGLIIAFFLAQSAVTYLYVSDSEALIEQAVNRNFQQSQFIAQLAIDGQKLRRFEKEYFIYVGDDRQRAAYYAEWRKAKQSIADRLDGAIHDAHRSWSAGDLAALGRWRDSLEAYDKRFQTVNHMVQGGTLTSTTRANEEIQIAKDRFRTFLDGTHDLGAQKLIESNQLAAQVEANFVVLQRMVLITSLLGIALLLGLLQLVPRFIVRPLEELTAAALQVSKGNLERQIPTSPVKEFRSLSETLERMRISQKTLIEKMLGKARG